MDYAYRLLKNVQYYYNSINPATLSGAIDLIVVEQPDGSYQSTPFHVRFGKYGVLNSNEKYVDIMINGEEISLKMKLGENGVAFFVEETDMDVPEYLVTSPLPQHNIDTAKVLAESAATLQRQQQRRETRDMAKSRRHAHKISPSGSSSRSRSQSPETRSRCQTMDDKRRTALIALKHKKSLPFSSSVFSARRYRSLPDLTTPTAQCSQIAINETGGRGGRTGNSVRTGIGDVMLESGNVVNPKRLMHSRSAMDDVSGTKQRSASADGKDVRASESRTRIISVGTPPRARSTSQESDGDDGSSSSIASSDCDSRQLSDRDLLQDGALSDSEVDRHRQHEHVGNDVTEWKWGEFPESKKSETKIAGVESSSDVHKSTYWDWFRWRRTKPKEDGGIYLDELVAKGEKDPEQMKVYIGSRSGNVTCQSPHGDSGNGSLASSGNTGPSSPAMVASDGEDATTSGDKQIVNRALTKAAIIERVQLGESIPAAINDVKKGERDGAGSMPPVEARARSPSSDAASSDGEDLEAGGRRYFRSLRLSSSRLKSLRLHRGSNEARFSVTTKFQGTCWCSCHIYLYKWNEKIVISDIDGTITKSDLLGHVIPAIGGTWAHAGVAELYTRIKNNGYQLVYLSSRAIGQSYYTKKYLQSVAQDSQVLPDGPVLLSPTSVLMAFRREVIDRRPEEFKIAALTDLKALFPSKKPFYAGIGNRETDVISYRAVNIPPDRILIVDPTGVVRRADAIGFISSYHSMAMDTVDFLFPPLMRNVIANSPSKTGNLAKLHTQFTKPQQFSAFTHWRPNQVARVDDGDEELANYERRRKEEERLRRRKQEEAHKRGKAKKTKK